MHADDGGVAQQFPVDAQRQLQQSFLLSSRDTYRATPKQSQASAACDLVNAAFKRQLTLIRGAQHLAQELLCSCIAALVVARQGCLIHILSIEKHHVTTTAWSFHRHSTAESAMVAALHTNQISWQLPNACLSCRVFHKCKLAY